MSAMGMVSPELQQNAEELLSCLQRDEETLVQLVEVLQQERKAITEFDASELLVVVARKGRLLEQVRLDAPARRQFFKLIWVAVGRTAELPEDVPSVLSELSEELPEIGDELTERASRLDALLDVVTELHQVNAELVQHSLSWMEAYMKSLMSWGPTHAYNSGGRPVYACPSSRLR